VSTLGAENVLGETLKPYRGVKASVVVWGVPARYEVLSVLDASYSRMAAEARELARGAGLPARGALADIAPVAGAADGYDEPRRRTVLLAAAGERELASAVRPIVEAGVTLGSLLTPAAALLSLARLHGAVEQPHGIEAYVALDEGACCIALTRAGTLLAAADYDWGYFDVVEWRTPRTREDVSRRLSEELPRLLGASGLDPHQLARVCVSGGMAELRSMGVALTELIDVEVEPLDSLFGVDAEQLPLRSDELRDRMSELRIAWAAAADERPPLDFLRERRRQKAHATLSRAAVMAGAVAGLAVGWQVHDRWLGPVRGPSLRLAQSGAQPPERVRQESPVRGGPVPVPPAREEPKPAARPTDSAPVVRPAPSPTASSPDALVPSPAARVNATRSPLPEPPAPSAVLPAALAPVAPPSPRRSEESDPARRLQVEIQTAEAFDAVLGTILVGPDRKLAIVDGRIVGPGDLVKGARILDISATTVLLRDRQGRLRHLGGAYSGSLPTARDSKRDAETP
jgi:hypothetical protein